MAVYFRRRSKIHLPVTLSVSLMALNLTLMICWIIILARGSSWATLTVGVVAFTLILAGLSVWLVLTLKEINLNNRQANFVDSVTHELKSPIAALQLYLETLTMRHLSDEKRQEFHGIMANELKRLDRLINQLLEVGRLDAIGATEDPEDIQLDEIIRQYVAGVCRQWNLNQEDVFRLELEPVRIEARRIVIDLILSNLIENTVKYAGSPPQVLIQLHLHTIYKSRVLLSLTNNGLGVASEDRKKIFQIFYRGGSELERRRKGTGLGLYIVHTLVKNMHGKISVRDRVDYEPGCTFDVELPIRVRT